MFMKFQQCNTLTYIDSDLLKSYLRMSIATAHRMFVNNEFDSIIMFLAYVLWNREEKPPQCLLDAVKEIEDSRI